MKKEEAISILATSVRPREAKDRARYDEAVKMAIEALKCSETPKSSEQNAETAQADHIADIGKKVSISCAHENDLISRRASIDAVHAMPDIKEIEKIIIDHIYIGDQKITDLVASGRLRLVGFCEECKHCFPPARIYGGRRGCASNI